MYRIAMIGAAGNIGGVASSLALYKDFVNEIILFDVKEQTCSGKAIDIAQCAHMVGTNTKIYYSNDYSRLAEVDVIIITAGLPRQPDMKSRSDLLKINAEVIGGISKKIKEHAHRQPFIIAVTNPLDVMTWLILKETGFPSAKVVGMSGPLDTSRLDYFLSQELNISPGCINSIVIGGHHDAMVFDIDLVSCGGIPLKSFIANGKITEEKVQELFNRARFGGAEVFNLLGGSGYFAPACGAIKIAEAYVKDSRSVFSCCAYVDGQYGIKDLCIGVPVIIGKNGIEEVIELPLSHDTRNRFHESAAIVRELTDELQRMCC